MRPIITTSWDDGHPLDLRVAAILARHGLRGTFYVPLRAVKDRVLSPVEMKELLAMGMEIGSHTVTHPVLTQIPMSDVDRELRDSRRMLEDVLGREVTSFCYPAGRFNRGIVQRAAHAGYRVCRTTVDFRTGLRFDPVLMPVSLQLFRHRPATHYRHALRHGNWRGLWRWRHRLGGETDPISLAAQMVAAVPESGGVFHLWGHSWEIEEHGLWLAFNRIAASLGALAGGVAVTNGEVPHAASG
jgi:peptidoglycan/xylan/chitin deacetylase (PgdA/CDA1 family)